MAVFKPINNDLSGFDRKSKQWQMIPVGGERKIVLEDGANFKVSLKDQETKAPLPTSLMSFQEHTNPGVYRREFTIKGHKDSKGLIYAEKSNDTELLFLRALPAKKTKLDFYLFQDMKNKTGQNSSKISDWVKEANKFIHPQTNVSLELNKTEALTAQKDFGSIIDAEELIKYLKQSKSSWVGTYPSIILVWRFNVNREGYKDTIGFTVPPFIIIEDAIDRPEDRYRDTILAHEIGHYFLGPDHYYHDNENLMFDGTLANAKNLTGGQIRLFHRNKPAYWSF